MPSTIMGYRLSARIVSTSSNFRLQTRIQGEGATDRVRRPSANNPHPFSPVDQHERRDRSTVPVSYPLRQNDMPRSHGGSSMPSSGSPAADTKSRTAIACNMKYGAYVTEPDVLG